MLTQETAARVWQAYREIETAKKLLSDMQEIREREYQRTLERPAKHEPTLTDAFGRKQHLQLGIPSGENGHRLLQVAPELGESVIRAHIAKMEAELVQANEQARMELDLSRSPVIETDEVRDFAAAMCVEEEGSQSTFTFLYEAYATFCEENNRRPDTPKRFANRLSAALPNIKKEHRSGRLLFVGVRIAV